MSFYPPKAKIEIFEIKLIACTPFSGCPPDQSVITFPILPFHRQLYEKEDEQLFH